VNTYASTPGLEKGDLQRPLPHGIVLANELVRASVAQADDTFASHRPLARERPAVHGQLLRHRARTAGIERAVALRRGALGALVPEVGLRRAQLIPVGGCLHADPFDVDELAFHAQQLDHALGARAASFAEVSSRMGPSASTRR